MVIKLVRVESSDASKITLSLGTHLFGRGKLWNVDDKRVSRKHGELQVKDDKLIMKALHHNPCFYLKKDQSDVQVLKCDCEIDLCSGDRFGLLPDSLWFEIIVFPGIEQSNSGANETVCENAHVEDNDTIMDGTLTNECPDSPVLDLQQVNCLSENENGVSTETNEVSNLHKQNTSAQDQEENGSEAPKEVSEKTDVEEPNSPQKRRHSTEEDVAKRVKVEPPDVKHEPVDVQPGPSADSGDSSKNGNNGMPPSPQKPQNNLRERCYYGATCYRRNPQHLAQFSHPKDVDWGTGEKGECPFGATCAKRDQKHWNTHTHPPGTSPPVNQGGQRKAKKRRSSSSDGTLPQSLIIHGKRQRHAVQRDVPSDFESEPETDPWGSDTTDEWDPHSDS